jgi:hypothetical protein
VKANKVSTNSSSSSSSSSNSDTSTKLEDASAKAAENTPVTAQSSSTSTTAAAVPAATATVTTAAAEAQLEFASEAHVDGSKSAATAQVSRVVRSGNSCGSSSKQHSAVVATGGTTAAADVHKPLRLLRRDHSAHATTSDHDGAQQHSGIQFTTSYGLYQFTIIASLHYTQSGLVENVC